ncbi:META domain-containing protein [Serinibacter salmoneus]|uniref:META domain-containing protein n=1 Tax=Serinibacter salmoneus TaxID=556530 RepID=A0A2A9D337_9MICO|nr:META domain-containing protein [Serinibacter salmoneus]PFG20801.1 META domain-containing protein [Serinibacter salmoneus]
MDTSYVRRTRRLLVPALGAASAALLVAGCATGTGTTAADTDSPSDPASESVPSLGTDQPLPSTDWGLTAIVGPDGLTELDGHDYTLDLSLLEEFDPLDDRGDAEIDPDEAGTLAGVEICNSWRGTITGWPDEVKHAPDRSMTLAGCGPSEPRPEVSDALMEFTSAAWDVDTLVLTGPTYELTYRTEEWVLAQGLPGTEWRLLSARHGEEEVAPFRLADEGAGMFTLTVDDPREPTRFTGTAFCNGYGAEVTGWPEAPAITEIDLTATACAADTDGLEAIYAGALAAVTQVRWDGREMWLSGPDTETGTADTSLHFTLATE